MPPDLLVDKNGLKNDNQLSKPIPPSKPLDISNWQPAPPSKPLDISNWQPAPPSKPLDISNWQPVPPSKPLDISNWQPSPPSKPLDISNWQPAPPSKPLDISNWQPAPPKWEKAEPSVEQMKCECEKFKRNITVECLNDNIFEHPFVVNNFKTFVYDSNAFEDAGEDESKTRALINGVLEQQNEENLNVSELEVVNHVKAINKACDLSVKELISIDGFKSVHEVLMEGVLNSAGELRTCKASTGMCHQYPHPCDIHNLLQLVIEQYQAIEESTYDIYTKAAWLKCQFLTIHPFEDGNGRLSRILVAVMFIKSGLYIFPPLSKNGHKKSTKHYINSLLKAAEGQSESELAFFFLKCCYNIACIFNNRQESCAVL